MCIFVSMGNTDTKVRCPWCLKDSLYMDYHDHEWGKPSKDDHHLFEMMILESFQAGLSWYTILKKRQAFREAFANFDVNKVAEFDEQKKSELMGNAGIIRNRLKIEAAVNNAKLFIDIQKTHGSFAKYLWSFTEGKVLDNVPATMGQVPASTEVSDRMAKDMKKRGFKFMGSTVCYAKMQSIGMVNDHLATCFTRKTTK